MPRHPITAACRRAIHRVLARSRDARGQGLLEYAIIGGVIIVGAITVLAALSGNLNHIFTTISNTLSQY